jgi:undecaprenyl-diphosphatase
MCGVKDSARYSFLISIPIIIASFVMELFEVDWGATSINWGGLIIAMIVCMIVGLLCIKVMTNLVAKNKLSYFAYYLIVLSILLLIRSV